MPCLSSIVLDITSANEQYKNWYKDEHEISGLTASAGVVLILVVLQRTCFEQSQRNIWKLFLDIQEPRGCCIMRISESSRWGGVEMLCVEYEIESDIQMKKLIENIRNAAWNEKKIIQKTQLKV